MNNLRDMKRKIVRSEQKSNGNEHRPERIREKWMRRCQRQKKFVLHMNCVPEEIKPNNK